jgi:hypothetical protein
MSRRLRLPILLLLLAAVIAYAWATDRPSPAEPHGALVGMILWVGLVLVVSLVVIGIVSMFRSRAGRRRQK